MFTCGRMKIAFLPLCIKIYSKWIKCPAKGLKMLEENTEGEL